MALLNYSLQVDQGATFRQSFLWRQGAAGSAPQDLTGYTGRMQIRQHALSDTAMHTLTTENGGITLGGVAGTVQLHIPASITSTLPGQQLVYDLEMTAPNGDVIRFLQGAVNVSAEVTR
jgi:hypothetical protein